jgi:hypothetical protein
MTDSISRQVSSLASGECRWIGRDDLHVYCRRPSVKQLMPTGRIGWVPGPATYSVVCPSAGLKHGNWINASDAVRTVSSLMDRFSNN